MSNSSDAENPYAVRSETEASEYSDRDAPKVIEVSGSYRPEDIKRTPRLFKVHRGLLWVRVLNSGASVSVIGL